MGRTEEAIAAYEHAVELGRARAESDPKYADTYRVARSELAVLKPPPAPKQRMVVATSVAAGVGVVGLASFVTFWLLARSRYHSLEEKCSPLPCPASETGAVATGRKYQLIANISLAVGDHRHGHGGHPVHPRQAARIGLRPARARGKHAALHGGVLARWPRARSLAGRSRLRGLLVGLGSVRRSQRRRLHHLRHRGERRAPGAPRPRRGSVRLVRAREALPSPGFADFISDADLARLAQAGFGFVRASFYSPALFDPAQPDQLNQTNLPYFVQAIERAKAAGLGIVFVPYFTPEFKQSLGDPATGPTALDQLLRMWSAFGTFLAGYDPNWVFPELMGAPDFPDSQTWTWNQILLPLAQTVRSVAPAHTIIADGNSGASARTGTPSPRFPPCRRCPGNGT